MKLCKCVAVLGLACRVAPSIAAIEEQPRSLRSTHTIFSEEKFECVLFNIHSMMIKPDVPEIHRLTCMADDHLSYRVENVPDDFFEDTPMVSGITRISVLTSAVSQAEFAVDLAGGNGQIIDNPSADVGRYTKTKKTARTVLVVRVFDSNSGYGPSASRQYLSTKIFGTDGSDFYNLVSGYETLSGGATTFTPATFGDSTEGGVMDLLLLEPINLATQTAFDLEFKANEALAEEPNFSFGSYDHIMYVLSNKINFLSAAAFAYLPGKISVFSETYAATYLVQMHEFGHNLGHHHSGRGNKEYEDRTCWMGAHIYKDEGPASCFNGAKSWQFGWYSSHHVELNPETANADLKLIGINDYLNGEKRLEHATIVKVNGDSETLYMLYNKKEGINSETAAFGDDVTIVHQPAPSQISWFRAGLGVKGRYEAANFIQDKKLVVEVCEMVSGTPDFARTIVYLDTVNNISCDGTSTSAPMSFPQAFPTTFPQTFPTASTFPQEFPTAPTFTPPQAFPTTFPQSFPTASAFPQEFPTASAFPQSIPTASPQASPTCAPSTSPQTLPTQFPQASPISNDDTDCMDSIEFLEKITKKKKKKLKTCSWLENKSKKKIKKYCTTKWRYLRDKKSQIVYKPPHDACPSLCHLCSPDNEEKKFKFFLKIKNGKSLLKNCKWLGKQDVETRSSICFLKETDDIYPSADVICPQTCNKDS